MVFLRAMLTCIATLLLLAVVPAVAQENVDRVDIALESLPSTVRFDERFDIWPIGLKINGRIIVDNGVHDDASLDWLAMRSARNRSVRCFIATAIDAPPLVDRLTQRSDDEGSFEKTRFDSLPVDVVKAALDKANVIALYLASDSVENRTALTTLRADLGKFIERGGTLIANGKAGEALSAFNVGGNSGVGLLPDCVLDCSEADEQESRNRLLSVLAVHRRSVGIRLTPGTMLILAGRKVICRGKGEATFLLMANEREPLRIETISAGDHRGLIDLTEWRRDAIDRTLEAFPTAKPLAPHVPNGTLVIVGGGGMPAGLMQRLVDLAGGNDKARMVYVPCSEEDELSPTQRTVEGWKKMGVEHATFIHTKDRNLANSDEEFLSPLQDATGLWFGGGRQWNFADSYYGTEAHRLMKQVLDRGGVIGGSSAGASIQGRYLARATPIGNSRIMAPGYERGGLGFLSGVAIDQHFSQRGRQKDMTTLVDRYPQLLGIGIDEATAIIVQKSIAEVVGRGKVHFYDRNLPVYPDRPDYVALPAGSTYDLAKREIVHDTSMNLHEPEVSIPPSE